MIKPGDRPSAEPSIYISTTSLLPPPSPSLALPSVSYANPDKIAQHRPQTCLSQTKPISHASYLNPHDALTDKPPTNTTCTTPTRNLSRPRPLEHHYFPAGLLVPCSICEESAIGRFPFSRLAWGSVDVVDALPVAAVGEIAESLEGGVWHFEGES